MTATFHTGLPPGGTFTLQRCGRCGAINYPRRELCAKCLGDGLQWQPVTARGVVQSLTELHYSLEPHYSEHLPWRVASIVLDCGPIVLAHLAPGIETLAVVRLKVVADAAGNRMLLAIGEDMASQQDLSDWMHTVGFEELPT